MKRRKSEVRRDAKANLVVAILVRVPSALAEELRRRAAAEERSLAAYVRRLIMRDAQKGGAR